jgi:hypothetical protein
MKKLLIAMFMFVAVAFTTNSAKAQTGNTDVDAVLAGLLAVNALNDVQVDIQTGDITLVNVNDVLNRSEINILTNFLNDNTVTIDDVLTNVLRDAEFLNNNQVVVGILSGGQIVFQNVNTAKPKKK